MTYDALIHSRTPSKNAVTRIKPAGIAQSWILKPGDKTNLFPSKVKYALANSLY